MKKTIKSLEAENAALVAKIKGLESRILSLEYDLKDAKQRTADAQLDLAHGQRDAARIESRMKDEIIAFLRPTKPPPSPPVF